MSILKQSGIDKRKDERPAINLTWNDLTKRPEPATDGTKVYLIKDFGLSSGPVCCKPICALMHRGLTKVQFLCECGAWHPIADHPEDTKNHGGGL